MRYLFLFTVLVTGVTFICNAQDQPVKTKAHYDHHHKKKLKKHYHDLKCEHHHLDYTFVVIDDPYQQGKKDAEIISTKVENISKNQKTKIIDAYTEFYLSINKFSELGVSERRKKCKELQQERDNNIHLSLNNNQYLMYSDFIKTWN
ncbi:hypothetical protein [Flammeovirga sp. SubArs3]|uniref:hypothetical protein n=1 Tax=Flammeovirga sp. SubArs3 TaxID=2995316 RepID=UPI00248CDF88|nr:hypothetical protein [Flammeovirga sp. SubArs3]